jgi:beta-lactamase class A
LLAVAPPALWGRDAKTSRLTTLVDAPWAVAFARAAEEERARIIADDVHPAALGAFVIDVSKNQSAAYEADTPMALASAMKLFVMVEAFRQREAGAVRFDERLTYSTRFIRDGAPALNRRSLGARLTVDELLTLMIRDSDNSATDMLLERLGTRAVQQTALAFGPAGPVDTMLSHRRFVYRALDPRADRLSTAAVRDVRWRNGFEPRLDLLKRHVGPPLGVYEQDDLERAFAKDYATGRNHAPMRTVGMLLLALANKRLVSRQSSEEMLTLLSISETSDRRVEGALQEGVPVAHKTGTSHKRVCDVGVVYLPDGSALVVAVAVAGGDREKAEDVIARLTRRAYDSALVLRTPR